MRCPEMPRRGQGSNVAFIVTQRLVDGFADLASQHVIETPIVRAISVRPMYVAEFTSINQKDGTIRWRGDWGRVSRSPQEN